VHLVLENDDNVASQLAADFDAQWNDDAHHVLHVLLTGETGGYYADYAKAPAEALARALGEGFVYQGEPSPFRGNRRRGTPRGALPPTAFISFLQNHDQIGNRASGERLTVLADAEAIEAAVILQLLAPPIPLIFMGEEWGSRTPFLFFTDHGPELARAVREGRRAEFASFAAFTDPARIPDPNDEATFRRSIPDPFDPSTRQEAARLSLYRRLLTLRREVLMPRLEGARAQGADAIGPAAVIARWRLGDGTVLTIAANLGPDAAPATPCADPLLFESRKGAAAALAQGELPRRSTVATLAPAMEGEAI
jgi:malto-oligosyltrehalose trehalohydrolase